MNWSLKDKGKLEPVAFRRRRDIQIYAGRRWLPSNEYVRAAGKELVEFMPGGDVKAIWRAVKRRNPTIRLVRVTVSESEL